MFSGILDEFKNAWNRPNNSVVQLILINLIVFVVINILRVVFGIGQSNETYYFIRDLFALPSAVPQFLTHPWTLITYMFTHEGFMHILWNMLMLYWFGKIIQEYLGSSKVIGLYVLGGLSGGLFYILLYNVIPLYSNAVEISTLVGASAGVLAIVVGAAVFMPNYTMFLLLFGPVKIKYIAMIAVFLSFIQMTGSNAGGEIAHLGGAFMGWLFISQLRNGVDFGKPVMNVISFIKSFFVRQPKIKVTHRSGTRRPKSAAKPSSKSAKSEQEEIDAILDKISQSGYESLTKDEKQKLFNASKK